MTDMYANHDSFMNGYQQQYNYNGYYDASYMQAPMAYNQPTNFSQHSQKFNKRN
jgi:hypothetical protein